MKRIRFGLFAISALTGAASSALAGAHTWRFSELFTNSSGTVQFVELWCSAGSGENFVGGFQITTGTNTFTFPGDLSGSTTNKRILLGTSGFAALPGAPTPDYTIPSNFFPPGGGFTIRYHPPGQYDTNVIGVGQLPTNGIKSLKITTGNPDTYDTSEANDPQNYSGGTGSVIAGCPDNDGDGYGNPGSSFCSGGPQTDCNDNDPAIHPNAAETSEAQCSDGLDNDCDGLTDCSDTTCATVVGACVPTVSEWGAAIFMLTLLCAGSVMLRGRV